MALNLWCDLHCPDFVLIFVKMQKTAMVRSLPLSQPLIFLFQHLPEQFNDFKLEPLYSSRKLPKRSFGFYQLAEKTLKCLLSDTFVDLG